MKRVYLDYAASCPLDSRVEKEIFKNIGAFGNPGSLHFFGQEALKVIDESRLKIAKFFGVNFDEIVFTHSATEANNLAILGAIKFAQLNNFQKDIHVLSCQTEHDSVLNPLKDLEKQGISVTYLPVSRNGQVRIEDVKSFLRRETVLVSIMSVNNETGIIQPIREVAKIVNDWKKSRSSVYPIFHTDAVQAIQFLDCEIDKLGVDLLTFSGHKIYGPKSVGGLVMKKNTPIWPIILGGEQENGFWAGTENSALIAGLAKAFDLVKESRKSENSHLEKIREKFLDEISKKIPGIISNTDLKNSVPSILNLRLNGQKSDELLISWDLKGLAVSAGSACSARALEPSHVLLAMGLGEKQARESIRFSFGRQTTNDDIERAVKIISSGK